MHVGKATKVVICLDHVIMGSVKHVFQTLTESDRNHMRRHALCNSPVHELLVSLLHHQRAC